MAVKRSSLGKGVEGLFPGKKVSNTEEKGSDSSGKIMMKISQLEPNPNQPRKTFEEDAMLELVDSIKKYGVIQPLLVKKHDNYCEIIAGERRWRAAKLAGLKEVPVVIGAYNDREILELSLIENIQREDLNPIEEALAYKRLLEEFSLKQDEVAECVSKSRTAVTNSMRLLKLNKDVQQMIVDDMITTGHARALLAIDDIEQQLALAMRVFDEKISVREIENIVKNIKKPKKTKAKKAIEDAFIYQDYEERMQSAIGTRVRVNPKNKEKGKIEIEYYSISEFEHIFDLITSGKEEE